MHKTLRKFYVSPFDGARVVLKIADTSVDSGAATGSLCLECVLHRGHWVGESLWERVYRSSK